MVIQRQTQGAYNEQHYEYTSLTKFFMQRITAIVKTRVYTSLMYGVVLLCIISTSSCCSVKIAPGSVKGYLLCTKKQYHASEDIGILVLIKNQNPFPIAYNPLGIGASVDYWSPPWMFSIIQADSVSYISKNRSFSQPFIPTIKNYRTIAAFSTDTVCQFRVNLQESFYSEKDGMSTMFFEDGEFILRNNVISLGHYKAWLGYRDALKIHCSGLDSLGFTPAEFDIIAEEK